MLARHPHPLVKPNGTIAHPPPAATLVAYRIAVRTTPQPQTHTAVNRRSGRRGGADTYWRCRARAMPTRACDDRGRSTPNRKDARWRC
jgi:hypothetical protein